MSTEPHLNIDKTHFIASLKGALASVAIPVLLLIIFIAFDFVFPPIDPENDGYIKGIGLIVAFLPVVFFIFLFYFLVMSGFKNIQIQTAIFISLVISCSASFLLVWGLYSEIAGKDLYIIGFSTFVILGISLCSGSWVFIKNLKT